MYNETTDTSLKCQPSNSGCTRDSEKIVSHAVEVNKILTSGAEEVSDSQQSVSSSTKHADKSQKSSKNKNNKSMPLLAFSHQCQSTKVTGHQQKMT